MKQQVQNLFANNFFSTCTREIPVYAAFQISVMSEGNRLCSLTLDEMSIKTAIQFDRTSDSVMGRVDLPHHTPVPATKALVFMLSGLHVRWKQTVAYFYTGE